MAAMFLNILPAYDATANSTNDNIYMTEEKRRQHLNNLQDEANLLNIPTFIFLILVAIVGIFGNSLILLVYSRKKKKTGTIVFIQSIAVVDLITNIIVIPLTFYVLFRTWVFQNGAVCKCFLYINLAAASTSSILLLAVAIVRYRKVCVPLGWQINSHSAKVISIAIALGSALTSVPYTIIHGIQHIPTDHPGITGRECRVDQEYVNTSWPLVVSGVSLTIFLSCCILLTAMYTRVGITAWRHSNGLELVPAKKDGAQRHQTPETSDSNKGGSSDTVTKTECLELDSKEKQLDTKNNNQTRSSQLTTTRPTQRTGLEAIGRKVANQTTRMLVTISIVYIVTNLTTLILVFIRSLNPQQVRQLGPGANSLYRLFLQIFMINSAANPFIYCMCDRKFKNESLALLKRLCSRPQQTSPKVIVKNKPA